MNAGLYIHVPFCTRICPYCDFAVHLDDAELRPRFVDAVAREVRDAADSPRAAWRAQRFDTIYLGGGTPSALPPHELAQLLDTARSSLRCTDDVWISLEANPEDVTEESCASWREQGVRTLSLGIQSFDDERLRYLGRAHSGEQADRAVALARQAGFPIVSVDVMFGTEMQTPAEWEHELDHALAAAPEHISCYQLTYHEGTPFWRWLSTGRRTEMPESDQADLYRLLHDRLRSAGWDTYEVSNFAAAPAFRSRHNSKYWEHAPYLGVGPSAHSFDGVRRRSWNVRALPAYLRRIEDGASPEDDAEILKNEDLATEAAMFGLRYAGGLNLDDIRDRLGIDLESLNGARFAEWRRSRLVVGTNILHSTPAGMAVADRLAADIRTR